MDPRQQLRRYLEQRRETGETELILDSLTIDEVLRIIAGENRVASAAAPPGEPSLARGDSLPIGPDSGSSSGDWRATLAAAGVSSGPVATPPSPQTPSPQTTSPQTPSPQTTSPQTPSPQPPAEAVKVPVKRLEFPAPGAPEPAAAAGKGLVVGSASSELFGGEMAHLESLEAIAEAVNGCRRCPLFSTATQGVPGVGNPDADLVCVGEAPGANEDATGLPFVGEAGKLLTKILAAIKLSREEVFICNVLKHRPPGNRNPLPAEVEACSPYLVRQLDLIKPKVIVAFGTFAAQTLLNTRASLTQLRGLVHHYYGTPLIVTYHPAALLRNPAWKRPAWNDVQLARRVLDNARAGA